MKIQDLIIETGNQTSRILPDDIGGRVIISPDSDKYTITNNFSIKYINQSMGKFFEVNSRIVGYDSHDHTGKSAQHLHIFQKSKKKGYLPSPKLLPYSQAYQIFTEMMEVIIRLYLERKNEKN